MNAPCIFDMCMSKLRLRAMVLWHSVQCQWLLLVPWILSLHMHGTTKCSDHSAIRGREGGEGEGVTAHFHLHPLFWKIKNVYTYLCRWGGSGTLPCNASASDASRWPHTGWCNRDTHRWPHSFHMPGSRRTMWMKTSLLRGKQDRTRQM